MSKLHLLILAGVSAAITGSASYAGPPTGVTIKDLGVGPGGTYSFPIGINNRGQIVGYGDGGTGSGGLLWTNGIAFSLAFPYPTDTWLELIGFNDDGQIVGGSAFNGDFNFDPTVPVPHPVLWQQNNVQVLALAPGAIGGIAFAINEKGIIAGSAADAGLPNIIGHAAVWNRGVPTDLGTLPGDNRAVGKAINDKGDIAGYSTNQTTSRYAALWSKGKVTKLGPLPGGTYSEAFAINKSRQVIGDGDAPDGNSHAILWSGGKTIDLGTLPGGTYSVPGPKFGIGPILNDAGQAVGWGDVANGDTHAILWDNGKTIDLGTLPGGTNSKAEGINQNGQVVGYSNSASGHYHAILWNCGKMIDLGTLPGGYDSFGDAINDAGQIAADGDGAGFVGGDHTLLITGFAQKCK